MYSENACPYATASVWLRRRAIQFSENSIVVCVNSFGEWCAGIYHSLSTYVVAPEMVQAQQRLCMPGRQLFVDTCALSAYPEILCDELDCQCSAKTTTQFRMDFNDELTHALDHLPGSVINAVLSTTANFFISSTRYSTKHWIVDIG